MKTIKRPEGRPPPIVCAQCGSSLGSSEGTEEFCLNCLLHTALGRADLDRPRRPRRFDQYELVNGSGGEPVELGRGGMGVTYKAFDTNLRYEVALKVIHPRDLADETSRTRFLSEARAAAQLRHRNIASVFHLGSKRDEYFYAMELVEGQTIEEWVDHKGPIDCPIALDIALQITRALIATGTRQFVHRDVKPSNVMLCTEADGAIVAKLIDFGLVRDLSDQSAGQFSADRLHWHATLCESRTIHRGNNRRAIRHLLIGCDALVHVNRQSAVRWHARRNSTATTQWCVASRSTERHSAHGCRSYQAHVGARSSKAPAIARRG